MRKRLRRCCSTLLLPGRTCLVAATQCDIAAQTEQQRTLARQPVASCCSAGGRFQRAGNGNALAGRQAGELARSGRARPWPRLGLTSRERAGGGLEGTVRGWRYPRRVVFENWQGGWGELARSNSVGALTAAARRSGATQQRRVHQHQRPRNWKLRYPYRVSAPPARRGARLPHRLRGSRDLTWHGASTCALCAAATELATPDMPTSARSYARPQHHAHAFHETAGTPRRRRAGCARSKLSASTGAPANGCGDAGSRALKAHARGANGKSRAAAGLTARWALAPKIAGAGQTLPRG